MEPDYELTFTSPFSKSELKALDVKDYRDITGAVNYDTNKVILNLSSYDFAYCNNYADIERMFVLAIIHETIHLTIHDILGTYAIEIKQGFGKEDKRIDNLMEEKVVQILTGEIE